MGAYVYRVTAERVKLTDGREANVAKYAYKPSWGERKHNSRMEFKTGCHASRRLVAEGRTTGRIVFDTFPGSKVYEYERATLLDDSFNRKPLDVVVANPKAKVQTLWTVQYVNGNATIMSGPDAGQHPVETLRVPADTFSEAADLVRGLSEKYEVLMSYF
jgi:hypothetical protein